MSDFDQSTNHTGVALSSLVVLQNCLHSMRLLLLLRWCAGSTLLSCSTLAVKSQSEARLDYWHPMLLTEFQAWIFLLRNCTIPKPQSWNETTFPNFWINFFYHHFSYKITWQVKYIHTYVRYIQLVFRPFKPKRFGKTRLIFIIAPLTWTSLLTMSWEIFA